MTPKDAHILILGIWEYFLCDKGDFADMVKDLEMEGLLFWMT